MKLRTTLKRVYFPTLIGIILLSVAFRIAAIFSNFNFETGFFDTKLLINIASVIVTAGSVFMFTYAFCGSKKYKLIADFSTPETYVPTGVLSVAMMFFAVLTQMQKNATKFSIINFMAQPGADFQLLLKYIASDMAGFILALMAPLALLSIGYFILNACVLERTSSARAFFGITNVLFLAFYSSYLYFDTATLARNAPNKIVDQMAFIFAALFFLYEIRISLGREKWNLYMAFGFIAASLTAYSSIPSLVVYFVNGKTISNNIQENVLSFALFVFIISRISLAAFLKEDKESESIAAIREYSLQREECIIAKENAAKRAYMELYAEISSTEDTESEETAEATQITFDDAISPNSKPASEYAEAELYISTAENSDEEQNDTTGEEAVDLIQERIIFPEDSEEDTEDEDSEENFSSADDVQERNI